MPIVETHLIGRYAAAVKARLVAALTQAALSFCFANRFDVAAGLFLCRDVRKAVTEVWPQ